MDLELKGKTIFVTGASSGIGRATAELFAAEGATVVIGYNTKGAEAERLRQEILARGGAAMTAEIDLGDLESIRRCMAAIVARAGTFDSVVFNAGAIKLTSLEEISEREWDDILSVNLKGPFFLLQAIAPHVRHGGSAVFVSSIAGQTGAPAHAHYAAAKAGLINLAKSAAKRYATAIRINCVAPGVTLTAMGEEVLQGTDLDAARGKLLARRFAEPAEVAKVVVFLASPAASFIYGATIDVNGGRDLR